MIFYNDEAHKINEFLLDQRVYINLIESIKSGIYIADKEGKLFFANQALVEILGYNTKNEIIGKDLAKDLYVDSKERKLFLEKLKDNGFVYDYEIKLKKKDGNKILISVTSNYIKNNRGEIIGVQGVVRDITNKRRLEEDLKVEKEKLEQIVDFDEKINAIRKSFELWDFIIIKTLRILNAERCSLMLLDKSRKELFIKAAKGLKDGTIKRIRVKPGDPIAGVVLQEGMPLLVTNIETDKRFKRSNRRAYKGKSFIIAPLQLENKIIGVINVSDKKAHNSEAVFNDSDLGVLCTLSKDIAIAVENHSLYKELKYLTITDPLTHIFNYRHFTKSLDNEIKRTNRFGKSLSLLMIDLDEFKGYNDTYGHLEGDALLKKVSLFFKENLRAIDTACRYAGDEFAIILPETNIKQAQIVAKKIKTKVEGNKYKRKVTLSIGVSEYFLGMSRYDFILKADSALYQAKKDKKNKICVFK